MRVASGIDVKYWSGVDNIAIVAAIREATREFRDA